MHTEAKSTTPLTDHKLSKRISSRIVRMKGNLAADHKGADFSFEAKPWLSRVCGCHTQLFRFGTLEGIKRSNPDPRTTTNSPESRSRTHTDRMQSASSVRSDLETRANNRSASYSTLTTRREVE